MEIAGLVAFVLIAGIAWVFFIRGMVAVRDHNRRVLEQRLHDVGERDGGRLPAAAVPLVASSMEDPEPVADHVYEQRWPVGYPPSGTIL